MNNLQESLQIIDKELLEMLYKVDRALVLVQEMISKPEWFIIRDKEKRAQVLNAAENDSQELRSFILKIVKDNLQNE